MLRAFLSHSSVDKPFVEEVATRLTRYQARIDSKAFEPGEDFRDEIRRVMDESDAFVLFVSPESLSSLWVRFEIDEAETRVLRKVLSRSLAIFIGGPVDTTVLPDWLRRVKAVSRKSPGQAARSIEALLLRADPQPEKPLFGRNEDLQRASRKLAGSDPRPRVLVAYGLEGIGRRSFLAKLVRDSLGLDLGPTFTLELSDGLEDLFMGSQLSSSMLTRSEVEREIAAFRALTPRDQAREVAGRLAYIASDGVAPCIVDRGAMLDPEGTYLSEFADVLTDFVAERDVYLCLIHSRTPTYSNLPARWAFFSRRLTPLAQADSQALITRLLRESNTSAEPDQVAALAEATNGYPPAAIFLAAEVEDYGVEVVLSDHSRMVDFENRSFARFLQDLNLTDAEHEVLVYLASESSLSLAGIASATGRDLDATARAVRRLVDLSILDVAGSEYSVASPIQRTVRRNEDGLGRRWYEQAFQRLEAEYWSDEHSLPSISIVDATLRAGLRTGLNAAKGYSAFVRPSLLVNAAQEMYHRQEYRLALDYLDRAEAMGRRTVQIDEIRIRSLAQLGEIRKARRALSNFREHIDRRRWYLEGFVDRKVGQHDQACSDFQRGYAAGDRTTSLLRDYADSLLRTDALNDAARIAGEALERAQGNVYILDLVTRIELELATTDDADRAVTALEEVDLEQQFSVQRRAEFLIYRRGNAESIRRAIALCDRRLAARNAPVQVLVALAHALVKARDWTRLEEVKEEIRKRRDIDSRSVLGRVDLDAAIQDGDWRRAERFLPVAIVSFEDRDRAAAILELKGADGSVLLAERNEANARAAEIRAQDGSARVPIPSTGDLYE